MKVADVALILPSLAGGGSERTAITLSGALAGLGYAVQLVCFCAEGPYLSDVPRGVELVDLEAARGRRALPGLVRYLRRCRPPVALAFLDRAIVLTVVAAGIARVPTQVVGRVGSTMSKAAIESSRWQDRLRPFLARALYRRCSSVVAVSHGVRRDLVDRIGLSVGLVRVIYNPVDVEGLARRAEEAPAHPWFSDGAPPVVLGVGRLTKQKDFPTLIRAFARVRRRVDARLVVLGEGEDRRELENLVAEAGLANDVDLPGFVDDPAPYLGRAGVFVLSSAWEGFGLVLVEALAAGTRVVSTDCESGPREILEDGRYGRLVPVGDPEAMAEAIIGSLFDEYDREVLRARARDFAPDSALPAYLDVLGLG